MQDTTTIDVTATIATRYGCVSILVQGIDVALLRAGTDTPRDYEPAGIYIGDATAQLDARNTLELPRGIHATGLHAHIHREQDEHGSYGPWKFRRGYRSIRRDHGDVTPAAATALLDELALQVNAWAARHPDVLEDVQIERMTGKADELRAQAGQLRDVADQLDAQADALEDDPAGCRWLYMVQRLRSGTEQRAQAVRTGNGRLVFARAPRMWSPPEDGRQLIRYRDEPADWTEDR